MLLVGFPWKESVEIFARLRVVLEAGFVRKGGEQKLAAIENRSFKSGGFENGGDSQAGSSQQRSRLSADPSRRGNG